MGAATPDNATSIANGVFLRLRSFSISLSAFVLFYPRCLLSSPFLTILLIAIPTFFRYNRPSPGYPYSSDGDITMKAMWRLGRAIFVLPVYG